MHDGCPDTIKEALLCTAVAGVSGTQKHRRQQLERIRIRGEELQGREDALHAEMGPQKAKLYRKKKCLLLAELLGETQ